MRWPREIRLSHLIALGGMVIVLFVGAFTALIVRQIDDESRLHAQEQVGQLHKAVTYQLGTMMVGIEQTMRHAEYGIRTTGNPHMLHELAHEGRISLHLLRDLVFIDPTGRVTVSLLRPEELPSIGNRGLRDYFTVHVGTPRTRSYVGKPIRILGSEREIIPVSHPVRAWNGTFLGVVVAYIDIEALERIWVEVGLTPQDRIELLGEDGKSLFSWPQGVKTSPDSMR